MTDELITHLAQIVSVRVISRTSIMQYKGARKALPKIGNSHPVTRAQHRALDHRLHVQFLPNQQGKRQRDRAKITVKQSKEEL